MPLTMDLDAEDRIVWDSVSFSQTANASVPEKDEKDLAEDKKVIVKKYSKEKNIDLVTKLYQ